MHRSCVQLKMSHAAIDYFQNSLHATHGENLFGHGRGVAWFQSSRWRSSASRHYMKIKSALACIVPLHLRESLLKYGPPAVVRTCLDLARSRSMAGRVPYLPGDLATTAECSVTLLGHESFKKPRTLRRWNRMIGAIHFFLCLPAHKLSYVGSPEKRSPAFYPYW